MTRGIRWRLASGAAFVVGLFAAGCVTPDPCGDEGWCVEDGGGGDTAAVALEAGADGATDSARTDAPGLDGGSNTAVADATVESSDGASAIDDAADGWADAWPFDGSADAGDADGGVLGSEAGAAAPLLGTWTLKGTETYSCPDASGLSADGSVIADPVSESVTFRAGPESTDAGQVDLLFDAGQGCALGMVVEAGVASLVSEPQTCALGGDATYWDFTSVVVSPFMGSFEITEVFTDRTGCTYGIEGPLTR